MLTAWIIVISGQIASRGGLIGNWGIERWLGHNQARLYLPTPTSAIYPHRARPSGGGPRTGVIIIKCMIRQDDIYRDHPAVRFPLFKSLQRNVGIIANAHFDSPQQHGGNRGRSIVE